MTFTWTYPDSLKAILRSPGGATTEARFLRDASRSSYEEARYVPGDDGLAGAEIWITQEKVSEEAGGSARLRVTWTHPPGEKTIDEVVLPLVLQASAGERLLLPRRMGALVTVGKDEITPARLMTGNRGLAMFLVAALRETYTDLVTWEDPGWAVGVLPRDASVDISLIALEPGVWLRLERFEGNQLDTLAEQCRKRITQAGWVKRWGDKVAERPRRERLEGAPELRALCLSRFVPGCWFNNGETDVVIVDYTFADVEAIARLWRETLDIDRALITVCGWMRRGYDNQHPDVFPAAAECGGDEGLRRASDAVQSLGFLFCLHDNYHDMYPDAPSWDPGSLRWQPDGEIVLGGKWAGGQAALMCSEAALGFIERNLPEIRDRYRPDAMYVDVIYAHPLEPCHHPEHPLTRGGDLTARRLQVEMVKKYTDVFGSEEGQGWGAADADYFEGLLSHYIEEGPEGAFPWFEWVLGDCVHLLPHAWDQATPVRTEYIVRCLSLGRMPIYAVPTGRYFEQDESQWRLSVLHRHYAPPSRRYPDLVYPKVTDENAPLSRGDQGWGQHLNAVDRFIKNTYEVLSPVSRLVANERMTGFERFGPHGKAVKTTFSGGVRIVVNEEEVPVRYNGTLLPSFGFLVEAPTFFALHASEWNGLSYNRPVLFTITSLDGQRLETCRTARIYHGFGDPRIAWRGKVWNVVREETVSLP